MARPGSSRRGPKIPIEEEITHLRGLSLDGLRTRWRSATGKAAPQHLPRHLLVGILAYRLQAETFGDLDATTIKLLTRIGAAGSLAEVEPLTAAYDQRRRDLPPGTVLMREWNGRPHRVMVVDQGFVWEGRTYDSLSRIAFAITGTKWNGPRFFGLRDKTCVEPRL